MQTRSTTYCSLFGILILCSCIEEFTPDVDSTNINEYVVSGRITDKEGIHTITVSKASPLSDPSFQPIEGCKVEVIDEMGNSFLFEETEYGDYSAWIDQLYLNVGTSYKLIVQTPDNMILESEFCQMPACPSLDSIYYIKEEPKIKDPYLDLTQGIRFFLDFSGSDTDSRYLKWEIMETWEYHAYYVLWLTIDRRGWHYADLSDRSRAVCWKTETLKQYFPVSTVLLDKNQYIKLPLHYVDNHTQRLLYGYFLKVNQYALSEDAYIYWKQVEDNSNQAGGLYEKIPLPIKGNIQNTSIPEQKVLGFFEVTSVNTKTIFIKDFVMRMDIDECNLRPLDITNPFPRWSYSPIYYTIFERGIFNISEGCWDCTARGGKNVKPDFWPY